MLKTLAIVATAVTLSACSHSTSPPPPTAPTPTPEGPVAPAPTPDGPIAPTPTPVPPASPTPLPAYDCTNHPLTGHTVTDAGQDNTLQFNADCTVLWTDHFHTSFEIWHPVPDRSLVRQVNGLTAYPITILGTSQYVCLPANGPQTCSNGTLQGAYDVYLAPGGYTQMELWPAGTGP